MVQEAGSKIAQPSGPEACRTQLDADQELICHLAGRQRRDRGDHAGNRVEIEEWWR